MTRHDDWVQQLKDDGWDTPLRLALDVLEPVGPLGAQLVWAFEPMLGKFLQTQTLTRVAYALENPDELRQLREALDRSEDTGRDSQTADDNL